MTQKLTTHTDYDLPHLEELQRVVSRCTNEKAVRRNFIFNIIWGIANLIVAGVVVTQIQNWIAAIIFVLMALYFFLVRGVFCYKLSALGTKQAMGKEMVSNEYVMEESCLRVTNAQGSNQFPYTDCARLLETDGNIYFVMQNAQGMILDKSNVKGGTVEELRAWLEEKCGKPLEWVGKGQKNS